MTEKQILDLIDIKIGKLEKLREGAAQAGWISRACMWSEKIATLLDLKEQILNAESDKE